MWQLLLQSCVNMLVDKIKKPSKDKKKLQEQNKFDDKAELKYISGSCLKICAWIVVVISVAIIITTVCLVIYQHIYETVNKIEDFDYDAEFSIVEEFTKSISRTIDDNDFAAMNLELDGCHEEQCKIACIRAADLYESLYDIIDNTACHNTDVLLIQNQSFPSLSYERDWVNVNLNHSVKELFIVSCNLTKIKNDAFNTPLFSKTFKLVWYNLKLEKVESGALLGLYSLKYLMIESNIAELGKAFFQPVQTTLTHLKLNAGLSFSPHKSLFGTSSLQQLEYLDLSGNAFWGAVTKEMFTSTPNLKYLIMSSAKIISIEDDAFVNLVGKLNVLNLSKNLLTNISPDVIQPLLLASNSSFINLGRNMWHCNCQIQQFVEIYMKHRSQFLEDIYCKAPHHLYGINIDAVDYVQLGCGDNATTTSVSERSDSSDQPKQTTSSTEVEPEAQKYFQISCPSQQEEEVTSFVPGAKAVSLQNSIASVIVTSDPLDRDAYAPDAAAAGSQDRMEYIRFEPPSHEFDLHLFENLSVQLIIEDFNSKAPINIIWFSEETENFDITHAGESIDYNCAGYAEPYMIIDGLVPNTTYTFCLIPHLEVSITPFSCLPLHVPLDGARNGNIWISTDEKQFTVGILCLIFMLSLFIGAVIAYLGIKTYPDLLEGSKNVLVVKKPDQTCYVSTITEYEYLKNSYLRKGSMGGKNKKNSMNNATPLKKNNETLNNETTTLKKNSVIPPLPEKPVVFSLPPFNLSAKSLERLYSTKSTSTCFEDSFVSSTPCPEDQYEMPKHYDTKYSAEVRCVPNNYGMSPASPPPLPKRNSNLYADNGNLVANRFSKIE